MYYRLMRRNINCYTCISYIKSTDVFLCYVASRRRVRAIDVTCWNCITNHFICVPVYKSLVISRSFCTRACERTLHSSSLPWLALASNGQQTSGFTRCYRKLIVENCSELFIVHFIDFFNLINLNCCEDRRGLFQIRSACYIILTVYTIICII